MPERIEHDPLLAALIELPTHDVQPERREQIREDCRAVLRARRDQPADIGATRATNLAQVCEALAAAALAACYLLGIIERTLMVFGS